MQFVVLVIVAAVIISLRLWVRSPGRIGSAGEARVGLRLRALPAEHFTVIGDLLVPTSYGTSQIDHVVVSRFGVFVIETKNLSGWIHGHERSEYWTQTIYHDMSRFRNPVKQNWAHVYALKEILRPMGSIPFHPIVVFAGSAELKNVTSRSPVVYASELIQTITDACTRSELTTEQVHEVARRLRSSNLQGSEVRKDHHIQIKARIAERKRKEQERTCPKCGGHLVLRRGRHGEFFGCGNYPRCRYTLNAWR